MLSRVYATKPSKHKENGICGALDGLDDRGEKCEFRNSKVMPPSSSSSSSSSNATLDSVAGELRVLEANSTPYPSHMTSEGYDEPAVPMLKSHSTNSSPMRRAMDRDADDDVLMTTMRLGKSMGTFFDKPILNLDPFCGGGKNESLQPIANSTTIDNQGSPVRPGSIRFAKNVTFHEWDGLDKEIKPALKRPNIRGIFHRKQVEPPVPPSSEYSATPDTTDLEQPLSPLMSVSQLAYDILPTEQPSAAPGKHATSAASSAPESFGKLFSPVDVSTGATVDSLVLVQEKNDEPYDPSLSLARKFDELSLDQDHSGTRELFSLRLQKGDPLLKCNSAPDCSYDHVDILDQLPPDLPNLSKSLIISNPSSVVPLLQSKLFSQGESEAKLALIELLQLLETSTDTERFESKSSPMGIADVVAKSHKIILDISSKLEASKVQLLKFNKQLEDARGDLRYKDAVTATLIAQTKHLTSELEALKDEYSKLSSKFDLQEKILATETAENRKLHSDMSHYKSVMDTTSKESESLDQGLQRLTRIFKLYSQKPINSRDELVDVLKELLRSHEYASDTIARAQRKEEVLRIEVSELHERHQAQAAEIRRLRGELHDLSIAQHNYETAVLESQVSSQALVKDNKRCKQLLKSLEETYANQVALKDALLLEVQQLRESSENVQSTNAILTSRTAEMQHVMREQVELVTSAQSELEEQARAILFLETQLSKACDERDSQQATMTTQEIIHTQKCKQFEATCVRLNSQIQELRLQNDEHILQKGHNVRAKEDEIKEVKRRLLESRTLEGELSRELKTLRLRINDKTTDNTALERKVATLTKLMHDLQEQSRSLRMESLRNAAIKQELKRALTGLSVDVLKEFEGIIDATSLVSVRDDLLSVNAPINNADEEGQLEKLNDAALFIEEAVRLIINENWSLTKRLDSHHKGALAGSNQHLQRVIDGQAEKIRKMEAKVNSYETTFRRISKVNQRDEDGLLSSSSAATTKTASRLSQSHQSSAARSEISESDQPTMRRASREEIHRLLMSMKKEQA